MQILETPIAAVKRIRLKRFSDERGSFMERFRADRFAEAGLPYQFPQDNYSRSMPGVLRGVHYQNAPAQGKLVGVMRGRIWDVAVDIRPDSATYGKHVAVELSEENAELLWIPAGFAHGFCVLGEEPADVLYKVTSLYNGPGEGGIAWDDPELNIPWPITMPILSPRDKSLPSFAEYRASPPTWSYA